MRHICRILLGALGLCLLARAGLAAPLAAPSLEAYLQRRVEAAGLPGASLAVVEHGRLSFAVAVGAADLKTGRPVTTETVYAVGSVTKSLTATAILQLKEQGLVDLDAPVQRYLPDFRLAEAELSRQITIRHLLTHTSGIPANAHAVVWRKPQLIRDSLTEGVRALALLHMAHPPGAQFTYSNMNYAVLGRVIEVQGGQRYPDYIQRNILIPLEMRRSAAATLELAGLDLATPYAPSFGRLAEAPLESGAFHGPAYLLFASAPDLARFAAAHLEPGRLLSSASLEEAHAAQVATGPGTGYGLGWVRETVAGETLVWHPGASGHSAFVALLPERGQAVVLLTGAYSGETTTEIGKGLVHLLLGQEPPVAAHPQNVDLLLDQIILALLPGGAALLGWWFWVVLRRGRQTRLSLRLLTWRAALLTGLTFGLWGAAVLLPPRFALPAPLGWFGFPPDLALTLGAWLVAVTIWTLWAVESLFYHRRLALVQVPARMAPGAR